MDKHQELDLSIFGWFGQLNGGLFHVLYLAIYFRLMENSIHLKALELDKEGQWEAAHELIQDLPDKNAAWIHAYLHRKEGDQWNAEYWYRRASQPVFTESLEDEWNHIYSSLRK